MSPNPLRSMQNMSAKKKVATGVASLGLVGAVVLGGASLASADSTTTPSTTSSSSRASSDTPVTGADATKVSAAVTAQDSAVTVTQVRQDPDGSYDVLGTKAGADVFYDVSADLATVTLNTGGGGHGGGGHGRGGDGTTTDGTSTDGTTADSGAAATGSAT